MISDDIVVSDKNARYEEESMNGADEGINVEIFTRLQPWCATGDK